jgi:para-nitrobenzyl esterase
LFRRAALQSGPPFFFQQVYERLEDVEADGMRFMTAVGAQSLAHLRQMSAWELYQESQEHAFQPRVAIDGWLLLDAPGPMIRSGRHNRVALLLGSTSDEFSDRYSPEHGLAPAEYEQETRQQCGEQADTLLEYYPAGDPVATARASIAALADAMFAAGRLTARLAGRYGSDAYLYYFTRVLPIPHGEFYGANHSVELPFLFHLVDKGAVWPWDERKWEPRDYQYSETVMSYWSNFVKHGDPNGENLPEWPKYDEHEDRVLEFGETAVAAKVGRPEKLAILESMLERV